MNAIYARNLTKTYGGGANALEKLDLEVEEGRVFGFLGPNGAGKTTTVKLLTGLLAPTEGECAVLGRSPQREPEEVHRACGVMTETARLYSHLSGLENLVFYATLYGMKKQEATERGSGLLKKLGIFSARDKKAGSYSTGMLQRLSLARALVARPRVLFLDEPTSGLDPESAQTVNRLIAEQAAEGATVFLCTHQLRYAQDLCDEYGIIDHGHLLARGSLAAMSREIGLKTYAGVRVGASCRPEGFEAHGGWWRTVLEEEEAMPHILQRLVQSGVPIYEAQIIRPTLEDVYFSYIKREEDAE